MQYLILIYGDEKAFAGLSEDEMGKVFGEYMAYSKEIAAAGVMKGGASLQPTMTETTVRVKGGKTTTTEGAFAETEGQRGRDDVMGGTRLRVVWKQESSSHGAE